jgi:hypothetical protein
MGNSTVNVRADVHSLSCVWNRTYEVNENGNERVKEQWFKVKIEGAEGGIRQKFDLLAESDLQFKVSTAERIVDAKSNNTYYPRGRECAQLFGVLADLTQWVDMSGFDASKWARRMPVNSLAYDRLCDYAEMIEAERAEAEKLTAEKAAQAKLEAERIEAAKIEADKAAQAASASPESRITETQVTESVPVVATAASSNGKKGKKQLA